MRRFQQDDAHIFCAVEQIEHEVEKALRFFKYVYDTFGFTFELNLSTRPEKYLGKVEEWDKAGIRKFAFFNTWRRDILRDILYPK